MNIATLPDLGICRQLRFSTGNRYTLFIIITKRCKVVLYISYMADSFFPGVGSSISIDNFCENPGILGNVYGELLQEGSRG